MVDSGTRINSGYVDFGRVYRGMIDAELARPAQGEIHACWFRVRNHIRVEVWLTNRSSATLATRQNNAAVHVIVYEETKVRSTQRFARAVAVADIDSLAPGATTRYVLETLDLGQGVNWGKLHVVALADYRPKGNAGPYDMLQATMAQREGQVYLPHLARR